MSAITQTITPAQVDAKSPIDELLMEAIRQDIYDLDNAITVAAAFDYQFKLNGPLSKLKISGQDFVPRRRVDGTLLSRAVTFSSCRAVLERPGTSGTLEVDVRRYLTPNVPITGVEHLFSASISSIARVGSGVSTQSISRSTAQISTQSISRWKTQLTVQSIILLGEADSALESELGVKNLVLVNLSGTVDADWKASAATVTFAGCVNSLNDGTFTIYATNVSGGNNVVISNASAVAQSSSTGSADLDAWKYVYTNPVSSDFVAGESATFSGHSSGSNDGTFPIYAINQSGNNIIAINSAGLAQPGAAGAVNVNRWKFALASAAPADFVAGESALTSGHTSGSNDGTFLIKAVNSGGNNVVLYNTTGTAQGGIAGTINTTRWIYTFASDPAGLISVGHKVWTLDATSASNRGEFTVKEVGNAGGFNVVVSNASGVAQVSGAGSMYTTRVKVKFAADQSSYLTTDSRIVLQGMAPNQYPTYTQSSDGEFDVLAVNLGGGSNYNAVVNIYLAAAAGACGRLAMESKSIFDTRPSLSVTPYAGQWGAVTSNAALNATQKIVPANTLIMMDVLNIPSGNCANLTVQLL